MWSTYAIEYCITMLMLQVLYFLSISMPIYIRQYCFYIMDDNMTKIVFNNTTIKIIMKIIFTLLLWHFQIIGDHFITAPTHEIADALAARNTTVFLYNFEYRSEYQRKDEGLFCLLLSSFDIFSICYYDMQKP